MASEQRIDGDSIGKMKADHERLRYVTKLLGSRQGLGLNTALLGAVLFFLNAGRILQLWVSRWSILLAALATVALEIGGLKIIVSADSWIPEYYERRFGRVQAAPAPASRRNSLFTLALLLALAAWLFFGRPITHYTDPVTSHLHMMISDPDRQINLWPSVFWAALLCCSLRWHMSSIERQRVYFMLAGMIGFASIVSYAIWHPDAKQIGWWNILNAGELGLSLIAIGFYDYVVLVRALPKRVAEGDDE